MGAVLIATGAQDGETLQLQFRGDGPLGQMTVISDHRGRVRGYVADPSAHPPPRAGKLDVGGRGRQRSARGRPLPPELARAVHGDRSAASRARSPRTSPTIW